MDGGVLSLLGVETSSTVRSSLPVGGLSLGGSLVSGLSLASGLLSGLSLVLKMGRTFGVNLAHGGYTSRIRV
jgi:hypothetical protein